MLFLQKYKDKQFFCGHNILLEGVFVTHLSSDVGISLQWIVRIMKHCCFKSAMTKHAQCLRKYGML